MSGRERIWRWQLPLPLLALLAGFAVFAQQPERNTAQPLPAGAAVAFASLDVIIETPEPLAAWQFELTDGNGSMLIVGVENGASPAFPDAPYFDLEAVRTGRAERIVVADFNALADAALPNGTTRLATVHVQLDAQVRPDYRLRLMAAGNAAGEPIDAVIRLATR